MTFEQHRDYRVRVRLRRDERYVVRPERELLDARELVVTPMWHIAPEDSALYANEIALGPSLFDEATKSAFELASCGWIASGDVVMLVEACWGIMDCGALDVQK